MEGKDIAAILERRKVIISDLRRGLHTPVRNLIRKRDEIKVKFCEVMPGESSKVNSSTPEKRQVLEKTQRERRRITAVASKKPQNNPKSKRRRDVDTTSALDVLKDTAEQKGLSVSRNEEIFFS